MSKIEQLQRTNLVEMSVSANLTPPQRSHLDKLVREWQALKGGLKASNMSESYDLGLIRKIKAKQEEIKEFLRTKEMGPKTLEEIRKDLIEWTLRELGSDFDESRAELRRKEAEHWVDNTFIIEDDGNIKVEKDLNLSYNDRLVSLPDNLHVNGDVYLNDCANLVDLGINLEVEGSLILRGCRILRSLPEKLRVEDNVDVQFCSNLVQLPQNLYIGGKLVVDEHNETIRQQARKLSDTGKIREVICYLD